MTDHAGEFFDQAYRDANGDAMGLGWVSLQACPTLTAHLDDHPGPGSAVIVGAGLGDDAEAAFAAGYDVTAFDISPTALEWATSRFPDSGVDYRAADLLQMPARWSQAFDLVVEIRTIQSLPPALREPTVNAIAGLVAPGGHLVVVALAREQVVIPTGPPWAVSEDELEGFERAGLTRASLQIEQWQYHGVWTR